MFSELRKICKNVFFHIITFMKMGIIFYKHLTSEDILLALSAASGSDISQNKPVLLGI